MVAKMKICDTIINMIEEILGNIKDAEIMASKIISRDKHKAEKIEHDSNIEISKIKDAMESTVAKELRPLKKSDATLQDQKQESTVHVDKAKVDKAIEFIKTEFTKRYS